MLRRICMKKQLFQKFNHLSKNVRLLAISLVLLSTVFLGSLQAATDHSDLITSYEGSKTCKPCHPDAVSAVLDSMHYKLMGEVQGAYNMFTNKAVEGIHGKGNRY